tara:strand:+ start:1322 stop:1768 length:447 start_codon:yes stop_codon:yes gene_type:complete
MFGLISYIFKVIISIGSGYIIGYNNNPDESSNLQFYTSLTSFLLASFVGVAYHLDADLNLIGLVFIAITYHIGKNFSSNKILDNYKILFSSICGMVIGFGFIFYAIIITLLFSYIANNFDIISDLFLSSKNKNNNDKKNELDLNDEEM